MASQFTCHEFKLREIILKEASVQIEQYGLRKFTMDGIAEKLKISKKTLYKYFPGKDSIIHEYFIEVLESDRKYTEESMKNAVTLPEQMNAIIFSCHKYRLPVRVVDEAHKFYPREWEQVQKLKDDKLKLVKDCLQKSMAEGKIKQNVNLTIIETMIDSTAGAFMNYEFLSRNNTTLKEAINEMLQVIFYGIVNQDSNL